MIDEVKVNKGFINLSAYNEVLPIVLSTLNLLSSSEAKENSSYQFLIKDTKEAVINILTLLATGYNTYNSENKARLYSQARDSLSKVQSNLLILGKLGLITVSDSEQQINDFENKIQLFNGIIRKMEKINK